MLVSGRKYNLGEPVCGVQLSGKVPLATAGSAYIVHSTKDEVEYYTAHVTSPHGCMLSYTHNLLSRLCMECYQVNSWRISFNRRSHELSWGWDVTVFDHSRLHCLYSRTILSSHVPKSKRYTIKGVGLALWGCVDQNKPLLQVYVAPESWWPSQLPCLLRFWGYF